MRLLEDTDRPHVMFDLEALGNPPQGAIVAIGACKFRMFGDGPEGEPFYATIKPDSCVKYGLRLDPSNINFWLKQPDEARLALFQPPQRSLLDVLIDFRTWYEGSATIWSHVTFDSRLLDDAFDAVDRQFPYSKRDHRDLRTLFDLAYGYGKQPRKVMPEAVRHHALHDATKQVYQVQAALKVLRGDPEPRRADGDQ